MGARAAAVRPVLEDGHGAGRVLKVGASARPTVFEGTGALSERRVVGFITARGGAIRHARRRAPYREADDEASIDLWRLKRRVKNSSTTLIQPSSS